MARTDTVRSRSVRKPTGPPSETSTTEPTLRSRINSAISRTVASGAAVTTDSVMTSRTSTRASLQSRDRGLPQCLQQLARRRRIESLIRVAAPVLDVVLYAGDRASRIVGRNEIGPEPARTAGSPAGLRH